MSALALKFKFDGKNLAAQQHAVKYAARRIVNISAQSKKAVRDIIRRSIREGIPPAQTAALIQRTVGLTKRQARSVAAYEKALRAQGNLGKRRIDELVDKMVNRKIRQRAKTIARTEIMTALNAGSVNSWKLAQAEGLLSKSARKEVLTRVGACSICMSIKKQKPKIGDPFNTPDGPMDAPPFHPNCRCTLGVRP